MTQLLKPETEAYRVQRISSASLPREDRSPRLSLITFVGRLFSGFCSLVGYVLVIAALTAVVLELTSWAIWSIHPFTRQVELENQGASPVYAGATWAQEFWREESARRKSPRVYVPFRVWGVTPWHGKYINNDESSLGLLRRTINPGACDPHSRLNVWTFGGSTMYGTAVPDWATIPSYLSHELNSGSQCSVVVSNFGVEGYVTDQELILLTEQLRAGGHPDVVIFYDGVNDSSLAWSPARQPGAHFRYQIIKNRIEGSPSGRLDFLQNSYAVRLAAEGMGRLHPTPPFALLLPKMRPNIIAAVDHYEANMRLLRVLAASYNFKLYCFWQPMLTYGHKPLIPFEQQMAVRDLSGASAESDWFLTMNQVYEEEERRSTGDKSVAFLGGLFDSTTEPIYVDEAHLGPRGNELVAHAIASLLTLVAQGRAPAKTPTESPWR